jgi:hypothetical protein
MKDPLDDSTDHDEALPLDSASTSLAYRQHHQKGKDSDAAASRASRVTRKGRGLATKERKERL